MAEFKMTIGAKIVEASGLDANHVFALLKEIVASQLEMAVTYDHLQPVTVNFPTNPENLLEPQEKTGYKEKGTKVRCLVDCPTCSEVYETDLIIGFPIYCRGCSSKLLYVPHVKDMFKAEKVLNMHK